MSIASMITWASGTSEFNLEISELISLSKTPSFKIRSLTSLITLESFRGRALTVSLEEYLSISSMRRALTMSAVYDSC